MQVVDTSQALRESGGFRVCGVVDSFVEFVGGGDVWSKREEFSCEGIESRSLLGLLRGFSARRRTRRKWRNSLLRRVLMRARR